MSDPTFIGREALLGALSVAAGADALEAALHAGLDPDAGIQRTAAPAGAGELLIMPAADDSHVTVKVISIGGKPWVQGLAIVFDQASLAPVAVLDGSALTELRTAAVSLLGARLSGRGPFCRLVVFGSGPQGAIHLEALRSEFAPDAVAVLRSSSSEAEVTEAVAGADLICCATTSRQPLFDGSLVADQVLVIAIGSHEPDARELDAELMRRSAIVVESQSSALAEAGELVMAAIGAEQLTTLAQLTEGAKLPQDRPVVFKSTGMGWEDAVIASSLLRALRLAEASTTAPSQD